jgi:PAS domain S-box-containing protein
MHWHFTPFLIPLLISTAISLTILVFAWRHRLTPGFIALAALALSVVIWSLGYALEIGSLDLPAKIFWSKVQYLGIVSVPVMWLGVILEFTRQERWLFRPTLLWLAMVPGLTLLLVWTTEIHSLVWQEIGLDSTGPFSALKLAYGPWFWINWVFANSLLLIGTYLLLTMLWSTTPIYRWQIISLLIVALSPWVVNAVYVLNLMLIPNLDFTPFAFAVSGWVMAWGLRRLRLFNLIPVVYKAIFENMSDGVIVLDARNRVVDLNPAATAIVGYPAAEAVGKTNTQVISNWPVLVKQLRNQIDVDTPAEIKLAKDGQVYSFDVRFSPLPAHHNYTDGSGLMVLRDITHRKQAEEALRKSEEQFRMIFDLAPIGMLTTTPSGQLLQVNRTFSQLLGYTPEELVGRYYFELIHRQDLKSILRISQKLRLGLIPHYKIEVRCLNKAGGLIDVLILMAVICDSDSQPVHFIGQVVDISSQKQMQEALIQARDQALEASRLKSELVAKVSHELRTPLTAILGFAEMLEAEVYGPLTPEQRQPALEIIDSVQYVIKLVNEILSQAQLEAGQLKLQPSAFSPAALVEKVLAKMNPLARSKDIQLITQIAPTLPATFWGDVTRLQQILVNLVDNAIKFTATGSVKVYLFLSDAQYWAIQVTDTGPGIPPEAYDYIFEPFRQVDGSLTREQDGAGLGLSIVKQLTWLMGGQIKLTSQVGQGSTFTVLLPLNPVSQEEVL